MSDQSIIVALILLAGCAAAPKPEPTICDYRIIGGATRSSMEAMQCVEDERVRGRSMARAARPPGPGAK